MQYLSTNRAKFELKKRMEYTASFECIGSEKETRVN